MRSRFVGRPDFTALRVDLDRGESVVAEPGALVARSPDVAVVASLGGGLAAAARRALAGEGLAQVEYRAETGESWVLLAPAMPGDVLRLPLAGEGLLAARGAWLAHVGDVRVDAAWGGLKGWVAGTGAVMARVHGRGEVWLAACGAIDRVDIQGREEVDTGHLLAFDESLRWEVKPVAGLRRAIGTGEGFVVRLRGQGRAWYQTRNPSALAGFVAAFRPGRR